MAVAMDVFENGTFFRIDRKIWWVPIVSLQIIAELRVFNNRATEIVTAFAPDLDLHVEGNDIPGVLDQLVQLTDQGGTALSSTDMEAFPLK